MYLDDTLTEQELADTRDEMRTARKTGKRYGSARDAMDALRPCAASQASLQRMASDLIGWFAVTAGRVTAWRTGPDDYVIETR